MPPAAMLDLLARLRPRDPFEEIVAHLDDGGDEQTGTVTVVGGPPVPVSGKWRSVWRRPSARSCRCCSSTPTSHRRVWRAASGWSCSRICSTRWISSPAATSPRRWPPGTAFDLVEAAVRCGRRPAGGVGMAALLAGDARRAGRSDPPTVGAHRDRHLAGRRGPAPLDRPLRAVPTPVGDRERVVGVCEATAWRVATSTGWPTRSHRPGADRHQQAARPAVLVERGRRSAALAVRRPHRRRGVGAADRRVVAAEWDAALPAAGRSPGVGPLAAAVAAAVVARAGRPGATSTKGVPR